MTKNVLILLRGGVNATRNRAREISYPEEGHESNTVDFSKVSRTALTGHKSRFSESASESGFTCIRRDNLHKGQKGHSSTWNHSPNMTVRELLSFLGYDGHNSSVYQLTSHIRSGAVLNRCSAWSCSLGDLVRIDSATCEVCAAKPPQNWSKKVESNVVDP